MIFVVNQNKLFGRLTEEIGEDIIFTYDKAIEKSEYLKGLNKEVNSSKTLFPIFENMLPEHEQLDLLKNKHKISNSIDILVYLDNLHGSFEFYSEKDFQSFSPKEWEIFTYKIKKSEILQNDYTFPNILNDYNLNIPDSKLYPKELANSRVIGLSGYQYKFSVIKDDDNKEIALNENKDSNYFMKPYSIYNSTYDFRDKDRSYIPYLLINEHLFMTLARDFGFDVPYNGIIKHNNDYHYIIKRFDRFNHSKIDHIELLTLMEKSSNQKYKVTMQDLVRTASEYIEDEERHKLFKFIIFSIVIAHGDLHSKNLSLINSSNKEGEEKKELSPFYDISTTKIYKDTKQNDIGLKIVKKTFDIKRKELYEFAKLINIDDSIVNDYINEVTHKFFTTFKDYIEKLPSEIKALPYYQGRYGNSKPFESILNKYYDNRMIYINKFLIDTPLLDEVEDEDDFWN